MTSPRFRRPIDRRRYAEKPPGCRWLLVVSAGKQETCRRERVGYSCYGLVWAMVTNLISPGRSGVKSTSSNPIPSPRARGRNLP